MKADNKEENGIYKQKMEEIWQNVESLPPKYRLELGQRLLSRLLSKSGLTVVLGGNNVINNSFAVQLNGNSEEMEKQIADIPTETLGKLVEAIANKIDADCDNQ